MELHRGRGRYVGYAALALAALWTLGVLPHAPRLTLPTNKPTWAELRDPRTPPSAFEARLGAVASSIAGRSVAVRCDDLSDVHDSIEPGGVVQFSGHRPANFARIRYDICTDLRRIARDGGDGGGREARAAEVLAHESFHLRGVESEAAAECYGIQLVREVAHELGATAANADRLHDLALNAYPYHPLEYLSRECHPGGRLDLHRRLPPPA